MSNTLKYRPEIDGLRAIAVVSVILYHAKLLIDGENILSGGYLGVDVFFVISGYLITKLLVDEIRKGTLSFLNFYERRARRILPVLLSVITISFPFAWFSLLPSDFIDYSYQILTSVFSVSNIYFWSQDSYWATDSILKPFLHTWSLGVEEQFYLIIPLMMFVILRFTSLRLSICLLSLCLLSLAFAHVTSQTNTQASFYLLPFRAWELLVGSLLAISANTNRISLRLKDRFPFLPTCGFFLLAVSIFHFDERTTHPSLYTFIPIVGVVAIIHFSNAKDFVTNFLSSRPMTYLGLISYSLYLWHFIIFSFLSHHDLFAGATTKLAAIAGTIVISGISYLSIEKPFRNFLLIPSRIFCYLIAVWISAITVIATIGMKNGFASRVPELVNVPAKPELIENHKWYTNKLGTNQRLILVGDSHIDSIAPAFREWALKNNFNFAKSGFSGCQLILNMNRVDKTNFDLFKNCSVELQKQRMAFLSRTEPSTILLGGRLPLLVEEERFDNTEGGYEGDLSDFLQERNNLLKTKNERQAAIAKNYALTVQTLVDLGHTVVLLYPIPEVGINVPKALHKRIKNNYLGARTIIERTPITTSHEAFKVRNKKSYEILDEIKSSKIARIYPENLFCNSAIKNRCITHNSEVSFYRDTHHLSDHGAKLVLSAFKKLYLKMNKAIVPQHKFQALSCQ